MANFYCQHGAYPAYTASPTFGTAQEGDGSATGLATVAQGSLLVNAVAVAGNTIVIMGVTLTAVASGATAAQFNVGTTTSIQADNLAIAINLATATVNSGTSPTTPQLRDLLYAISPSTGGTANTCQIQTRAGGTSMNFAANANVAMSSSGWSVAPTVTNFIGGLGGSWGYFTNDTATIWKSAKAQWTYGIGKNGSGLGPLIGSIPTASDTVNIRSGSPTQSNTSVTTIANGTQVWQPPFSSYYLFDDATIWPADVSIVVSGNTHTSTLVDGITSTTGLVVGQQISGLGIPVDTTISVVSANSITLSRPATATATAVSCTATPTFVIQNLNSVSYSLNMGAGPSVKVYIGAKTSGRFILRLFHASGGSQITIGNDVAGANACVMENVSYVDACVGSGALSISNVIGNNNEVMVLGGSYVCTRNSFYQIALLTNNSYNFSSIVIDGLTFSWPSFTGTPTSIATIIGTASTQKIIVRNCTNLTTSIASSLFVFSSPPPSLGAGGCAIAENNQGMSVNNSLGVVGLSSSATGFLDQGYILQQNVGATRQFRVENNSFSLDWAGGLGFPTLSATLPDGTLWAYRLLWAGPSLPGASRNWYGTEVTKLVKTVVSASMQTVTVELYVPSALGPVGATPLTNYNITAAVNYVAAVDSKLYGESSTTGFYNRLSPTSIPASTAVWTANSFAGYTAIKLTFTLTKAILAGTEIDVAIRLLSAAPTSNQIIFIHPDIGLS